MTTKIDGRKIAQRIRARVAEDVARGGGRCDEVAAVIDELASDPEVSGVLLQLPLPPGLDAVAASAR
jgi:5,10-methylene-tetrahydrofolate dehydrogenase/methenyl tetrahydrofolate cyclohydrolase